MTIWHRVQFSLGFALALSMAAICHGHDARPRIGVVISSDAYYFTLTYQSMTEQVLAKLPEARFTVLSTAVLKQPATDHDYELLVAIGTEATRGALKHSINTPLLATFVTEDSFRFLLASARGATTGRKVSAIYMDQPTKYRLRLARLLLPRARTLGTALGPLAKNSRDEYTKGARDLDFDLLTTPISLLSNPDRELTPLFREADVFVVAPDAPQLNQAAARWVLNLGYRNRIPVIGFSRSYTRAGALASLYTTPEDIGRHTGESIAEWLCCGADEVWQPTHSRYFTVDTNLSVAYALGMQLPAEATLIDAIRAYSETP